jgi:2-polyprenyl-3-methyl-5-hydroxy-6-metoxy-1,4-benzoquinol methylase
MRLFGRKKQKTEFSGTWDHRIGDVFECGVDYRGKTILDAGCNMGIVDYEIAKKHPKFIHGIDEEKWFIEIARSIFLAVPVESQFDVLDLTRNARLVRLLHPHYDIVLLLSVYPHVYRESGQAAARLLAQTLFARCSETFVLRASD